MFKKHDFFQPIWAEYVIPKKSKILKSDISSQTWIPPDNNTYYYVSLIPKETPVKIHLKCMWHNIKKLTVLKQCVKFVITNVNFTSISPQFHIDFSSI